jgi:predicted aldo/keto reductase-like oxidoreductase
MHYRVLGKTSIKVSEIGFGAWVIGTSMYGDLDREYSVKLIKTALDLGVNVFDTADMYGDGLSEKVLDVLVGLAGLVPLVLPTAHSSMATQQWPLHSFGRSLPGHWLGLGRTTCTYMV